MLRGLRTVISIYWLIIFLVVAPLIPAFSDRAQAQTISNPSAVCNPQNDPFNPVDAFLPIRANLVPGYSNSNGQLQGAAQRSDVGSMITLSPGGKVYSKVEALIYRSPQSSNSFSQIARLNLVQDRSTGEWSVEYRGNLPNGAYKMFVLGKAYTQQSGSDKLTAQGCTPVQIVTKGQTTQAQYCNGNTAAATEIGFQINPMMQRTGGSKGVPLKQKFRVNLKTGLRNATQPKVQVKRTKKHEPHVSQTVNANVSLGNATVTGATKYWEPTFEDAVQPNGEYVYHLLGEITVNGKRYTTCAESFLRSDDGSGSNEDTAEEEELTLEQAREWFGDTGLDDLVIVVPDGKGEKPYVSVSGEQLDLGSDIDFKFKLWNIFGNGGYIWQAADVNTRQLDYAIFRAYAIRTDSAGIKKTTLLKNIYYWHDERGQEGYVEYGTSETKARINEYDENLREDWDVTEDSWAKLYRRLYNEPARKGAEGCADGKIIKIGPEQEQKEVSSTDLADELNGNCLADPKTSPWGWPAWWGVEVNSIPLNIANSCSFNAFTSLFSEGIGVMIAKMLACIFGYLFEGSLNGIQPVLCGAAERSMIILPARAQSTGEPDNCQEIRQQSPVQSTESPRSKLELKTGRTLAGNLSSFFVGTAQAQEAPATPAPTGSFEEELRADNSIIVRIWSYARSLLNIVVIFALLAIAFANILHLNINTYAAKKILPGLVLGVIAANASLLIVRFLADVCQALSHLAVDLVWDQNLRGENVGSITQLVAYRFPVAIGQGLITGVLGSVLVAGAAAPFTGGFSLLAWVILMIVLVVYYIFLVIAFTFALLKRVIILYFLTMMAPLAFAAYGIPQFQKYFFQWWENFLRYLFLFPIILFGMALTVKLAEIVGIGSNLQFFNAPGIVSILLVLTSATLVLKLPKIVTKGAIDVGAAFKKAIGAAPRIAQGVQAGYDWKTGRRTKGMDAAIATKRMQADALRRSGDRAGAGRLLLEEKALRKERRDYTKKIDDRKSSLKTFRGFSTAFARPELLQEAWQAREARTGKDDYIAAMTKTKGMFGAIRGADAEYELAAKLAADETKDARTKGDLEDWLDTLGGGHNKRWGKKIVAAIKAKAGGDEDKMEELRQKFSNLKSREEADKFLAGIGLEAKSVQDYHDIAKMRGFELSVTRVARSVRPDEEGISPYSKMRAKVKVVDPDGRYGPFAGGANPPPGRSGPGGSPGGSPYAGGGPSAAATTAFVDDKIRDRIEEVFRHGTIINPNLSNELHERLMDNMEGLKEIHDVGGANDPTFATALENSRKDLLEAIGSSMSADANALRDAVKSATDPAQLLRLSENFAIAHSARQQGGDFKQSVANVMSQASQGSRDFHQAHGEMMSQLDMGKLEQAITSSLNAGGHDMAEVLRRELGDGVAKLSQTLGQKLDPNRQEQLFQHMAQQIQGTMVGPGQKTLKNILQTSIQSLPKTFAAVIGTHTLHPAAMEAKVPTPQPTQPAATPPPPTPPPTQ